MTFEVDFTVVENNEHISIHTAWISAANVTECKDIASELASEIEGSSEDICLHIGELDSDF